MSLIFETFFNTKSGYSLKKTTTESYVRDTRFSAHGCALRRPDGITEWYDAKDIRPMLERYRLADSAVVMHHAHFDGLILAHHYGVYPRLYIDILSMARALLGNHVPKDLGSLAKMFSLPEKTVPYQWFDGKYWEELAAGVQVAIQIGAKRDVEITWEVFTRLARVFPMSEYPIVDMTIRMFTRPVLRGDLARLQAVEATEQEHKRQLLEAVGVTDASVLRSDNIFAALLQSAGCEPGTKQGKLGLIYAFAKTDQFMLDLLDGDDPYLEALAEARLRVRSSIVETRARRLQAMAQRGPLCVYLAPYAAVTTRFGGGDRINFQNLTPALQTCIEGDIIKADASNVEARILCHLAGQTDAIDRFRSGADPYVAVASEFYGRSITKKDDPAERQVGKVLTLSSGFGAGASKLAHILKLQAGIVLDEVQAIRARDAYRNTHRNVVQYWGHADAVLAMLVQDKQGTWGPLTIRDKRLWLPNGLPMIYDTLEWSYKPVKQDNGDYRMQPGYWVKRRSGWQKLYGAKLVENVVQAIARTYLSDVMNRLLHDGVHILLSRHDDLIIHAPSHQSELLAYVEHEMCRPPEWMADCPLGVEASIRQRLL